MRKVYAAIFIPFLLPIVFFLIDFLLRKLDGDIHTGGMSDNVGHFIIYGIPIIEVAIILWAAWKKSPLLAIPLSVLAGYLTYKLIPFIWLYYVCYAGIDCI